MVRSGDPTSDEPFLDLGFSITCQASLLGLKGAEPGQIVTVSQADTSRTFTNCPQRFRLCGIDCPELHTLAGRNAKAFVQEALSRVGFIVLTTRATRRVRALPRRHPHLWARYASPPTTSLVSSNSSSSITQMSTGLFEQRLSALTLQRHSATIIDMTDATKRSTIYFDPQLHQALRLKAAETDRSISSLVNDAVKLALTEDAEDLAAFEKRASEPSVAFENAVKALRRSGKI